MREVLGGSVVYDESGQCFEIYGIRYAVDLFRGLGLAPIGTVFKIVDRGDGCVTLQRIEAKDQASA